MNYYVKDGEQQYGPYSLAELQKHVQSGKFLSSTLAQSEGMPDWLPISHVLGNIPIPAAESHPATAPPAFESDVSSVALPPNLNWGILLILVIFTRQFFNFIWALVLGNWARKFEKDNKPLVLVAMYPAGLIGGFIAMSSGQGIGAAVGVMLILGGTIAYLIGIFTIKATIENYYSHAVKKGLTLSGVRTFFFSTIYLQYHINKIARWKKTGELRDTFITP